MCKEGHLSRLQRLEISSNRGIVGQRPVESGDTPLPHRSQSSVNATFPHESLRIRVNHNEVVSWAAWCCAALRQHTARMIGTVLGLGFAGWRLRAFSALGHLDIIGHCQIDRMALTFGHSYPPSHP